MTDETRTPTANTTRTRIVGDLLVYKSDTDMFTRMKSITIAYNFLTHPPDARKVPMGQIVHTLSPSNKLVMQWSADVETIVAWRLTRKGDNWQPAKLEDDDLVMLRKDILERVS